MCTRNGKHLIAVASVKARPKTNGSRDFHESFSSASKEYFPAQCCGGLGGGADPSPCLPHTALGGGGVTGAT